MNMSKFALGIVPVIAAIVIGSCSEPPTEDWSKPAGREWPMIGGDWGSTRYSTLNEVNTGNVGALGGAWFHDFDRAAPRGTPVVFDGRMFVASAREVYALDPATGETLWVHEPHVGTHGLYKGVAVGEGLVFVGLADSTVTALRQDTGELVWSSLVGDEDADVRDRIYPKDGQMISAAPTYIDGLVIAGLAIGDYGLQGRLIAMDAKTGEHVWRFNAVPDEGEAGYETWPQDHDNWKPGGAGVWMSAAADPELGLLYIGIGNPIPQWGGEAREGDNLYSNSLVALDIKTGEYRWHYQVTRHDIWEADLGTPLILYDAVVDGKNRKAVAAMTTYGYLFLFDRITGEPIWPIEERPVPQNARLHTAATQPFPAGADRIGPECVPEGSVPEGFLRLCHYDPVDYDMPNAMYPMMTMRAAPMAYSPRAKRFYGTGAVWPSWVVRGEDPWYFVMVPSAPGMKFSGILASVDPQTNKLVWEKNVPFRTQHNGSGFTATAGGLLINGNTDGIFEAYEAATGEVLWQFQTGASVNQPPAIYEVDGSQYIAVVSAKGVWAFKLNGALAQQPAPPVPPEGIFGMRGRVVSTNEISLSAVVKDSGWIERVRERFDEYVFAPARAGVDKGARVTWTNNGQEPHTIRALDGSWTTGTIAPGKSASLTFDEPGRHTYICDDHRWSYGELIVGE